MEKNVGNYRPNTLTYTVKMPE